MASYPIQIVQGSLDIYGSSERKQHSQPCGIVSDAERYKVAPGRRTDLLPIPNHHNYLFHTSTFDA